MHVISYIIAPLATLFFIWLLIPVAHKIGLLDHPGGRKQHHTPTPLIGGIAICFGFFFALTSLPISLMAYRALIAAAFFILSVGVADDLIEVSAKLRLVVQILAALILVFWGHDNISFLGNLLSLGNIHLGQWGIPLTIFIIVAYINAFNMLDGQDGLATLVSFVQFDLLFTLATMTGQVDIAKIILLLSLSLLVFLAFNMPLPWRSRAKIFLGDAGSTFLALLTIAITISLSQHTKMHNITPLTYLWVISYPIFDLASVSFSRIRRKISPMTAGRDHFHHLLVDHGYSKLTALFVITMLTILIALIGVLLNYFAHELVSMIAYVVCLILFVLLTEKYRKHQ